MSQCDVIVLKRGLCIDSRAAGRKRSRCDVLEYSERSVHFYADGLLDHLSDRSLVVRGGD